MASDSISDDIFQGFTEMNITETQKGYEISIEKMKKIDQTSI